MVSETPARLNSRRSQLTEWIEEGAIPPERVADALEAVLVPDGRAWRVFLDRLLLTLGALALAFGLLFFIAYNWNEIGRFAKFAMIEGFLVLAIAGYWRCGAESIAGKVSLLVATVGLGVLLAFYGQTYQTGADPWQLFFTWALLLLPWVLVGRFAVLWIVWIALINTAVVLYHETFISAFWFLGRSGNVAWIVFLLNLAALAAWEFSAGIWSWLAERWAVRLLAVASGGSLTWLVLLAILDQGESKFAILVWAIWLGGLYFVYRRVRPDLFMLAGFCLSLITVAVTFLGRHLLDSEAWGFLVLLSVVVAMGTGAAIWLKRVHEEFEA